MSYEIPLGMSVLGVVLLSGTLNLEKILNQQAAGGFWHWNIWYQPLACLIFYVSSLAESNRLPFDLSECEQELVGGYHTEYGGLRMVMFFLGEYTHLVTISFLTSILFFGGWHFPWIATPESAYTGAWLVKVLVLLTKVLLSVFLIMLIRWTIPRFRFDQLMELTWKVFIPLSLANMVAVMIVLQFDWNRWWLLPISIGLFVLCGLDQRDAKRAEINRRAASVVGSDAQYTMRFETRVTLTTEFTHMPINPKDVTWIEEPEIGFWEATFLPGDREGAEDDARPRHRLQAGHAAVSGSEAGSCRSIIAACIGSIATRRAA